MTALHLDGVCLAFGGLRVTRDVSLTLQRGSRMALIGPNGAGKSTLVNLIAGTLRPSAGRISLGGQDVTRRTVGARARLGLARSYQVSRLFPDITVADHLALAVLHRSHLALCMSGLPRARRVVRDEVTELASRLGLIALLDRPVGAIAYGEQRLVELAMALALRPAVLLLDEPAAGIAQAETPRLLAALRALPQELAVLMVEHDMHLVAQFAQDVTVLAAGAVIARGTPAAVMADPAVRAAYLGHDDASGRG